MSFSLNIQRIGSNPSTLALKADLASQGIFPCPICSTPQYELFHISRECRYPSSCAQHQPPEMTQ